MREQLQALSKETAIYGMSTIVGRFLNFLLVPFYVNVLRSTAEYGMATSLYTYIGFLTVVYPLGLDSAFFRYGSRGEGQAPDLDLERKTFSPPFLLIFAIGLALSLLIHALAPVLVGPVFHDKKFDITPYVPTLITVLRYGGWILFLDSLMVLPFAVLRLEHQAFRFAFIRLAGILLTLVLNYVFIVRLQLGVRGIFLANLIGSGAALVFLIPTVIERLRFHADMSALKKLLPFGLTNVPAALSSMMVQVIDRPIVQAFLGLGALGVYQANYRMGFVMMIFVGLFEYAWRPFFMRQHLRDDAAARRLFARVFTYFMAIALFALLALSWGLPMLVSASIFGHRIFKEAYLVGLPIIPVVLLAYVFQGMYTNFIAGIYIKEKNKYLPLVTGLGAGVNIVANLLLIPVCGMMGAALATLFAYILMAVALYRVSHRVYPIEYEWGKVAGCAVVIALAFLVDFGTLRWIGPNLLHTIALRALLLSAALFASYVIVGKDDEVTL
jgi:O-antigen/teichoic acid export membrane protein